MFIITSAWFSGSRVLGFSGSKGSKGSKGSGFYGSGFSVRRLANEAHAEPRALEPRTLRTREPWNPRTGFHHLNSVSRTSGSRTINPSANRTPASAPNWASRLSISWLNVSDVKRVDTAPSAVVVN